MKILRILGAALLGCLLGWLGAHYGPHFAMHTPWSSRQKVVLLLLLPVAWLLAVLVHELGHVLVGKLNGFVFQWVAVGPFRWKQDAGRLRFQWNKDLNTAGGMALCVPPDAHDIRRRFLRYAAGGPLASVLFCGVALGLYALTSAATSAFGQVVQSALLVTGGISGLLAVATLVPARVGGFYSDGARILNLWGNGPAAQLEVAVLAAMVPSMAGTRPRELNRQLLDKAAELPQELPFKLYVFHYLYLIALDTGQVALADQYLRHYRERLGLMPAALQGNVWLESAFFAAAYQHDLAAAQAFQARAKPSGLIPADVPARVAAALARLAGDPLVARRQAQQALEQLPKNLDQGSARLYAEWLQNTVQWAAQHE